MTPSSWSRMSSDNCSMGLKPIDAAKAAMAEVTGPIIATTAVLMAVFVPVAFLPGVTGQLYNQFALTIAISVGDLGLQLADLEPGLERRVPAQPAALALPAVSPVQHRLHPARPTAMRWSIAASDRRALDRDGLLRPRLVLLTWGIYNRIPTDLPSGRKTRAISSPSCSFPTAPRSSAPKRWRSRCATS